MPPTKFAFEEATTKIEKRFECDPRMTRDRLATVVPQSWTCQVRAIVLLKNTTFHTSLFLNLPRNQHMELHKVLHKVLRLPRHLLIEGRASERKLELRRLTQKLTKLKDE